MYSEKVISRKKDLFDNIVTSTKLYRRFNHYMYVWSMTQNHQFILHLTITSNNSSRLTYLLIPVLAHCNHFYYLFIITYNIFFLCNHTIWISGLCIIKKKHTTKRSLFYTLVECSLKKTIDIKPLFCRLN